ncbi:solute carrier family 25 member 36 isoform X1 [Ambystoma mexicanum]|uniref:solute carrier family 25 member 36 isoform X1 n=1 Tax=Ambystoma mexicanum TaxID=8296 RepID=UPI0037E89A06
MQGEVEQCVYVGLHTSTHGLGWSSRRLLYISPVKRARSCHLMLPIRRSLPAEIWTNLNLVARERPSLSDPDSGSGYAREDHLGGGDLRSGDEAPLDMPSDKWRMYCVVLHQLAVWDPGGSPLLCSSVSDGCAGFTAITATNPIWLIKTRLQLDARNRGEKRMSAFDCIRKVYQADGVKGFYRGMSASYAGISETVIHFVIYESIKRKLLEQKAASAMDSDEESVKEASDFVGMMLAAATSKTCATSIAYPHEVVRTRLREEGTKYHAFFQTVSLVVKEEGYSSLYRGLTTHLFRQIPNTAIMMSTYELVVYLLNG